MLDINQVKSIIRQIPLQKAQIKNMHTYIIRKHHLAIRQPPTLPQPTLKVIRKDGQYRSKSESTHPKKQKINSNNQISMNKLSPDSPRKNDLAPSRSIMTQHNSSRNKKSQSQEKQRSNLLNPVQTSAQQADKLVFKSYLTFIMAKQIQNYSITVNFDRLRRRRMRDEVSKRQNSIFILIETIYDCIYNNLNIINEDTPRIILQYCKMYLQAYQKTKVQILFSIHYPNMLHSKLRPFFVYHRLIVFLLAIYSLDNRLIKMTQIQIDSFKVMVKFIRQCYSILFETIKQKEEEILSCINQTFRMLKAIGEIEKKLQVIEKEIRRIPTKYHKVLIQIDSAFKPLLSPQQQWNLQKLTQIQMELAWKYLQIPPIPYLPPKSTNKVYTLIVDIDQTLIHYDPQTKVLKYRPYIDLFLHTLSQHFQIVAFSRAPHLYTEMMVSQIQKNMNYFHYALSQEHLTLNQGNSIKDIARLGRDLKKIIAVDHSRVYYKHLGNVMEMMAWYGDKSDRSLQAITKILMQLVANNIEDVRIYLKEVSSTLQLIEEQNHSDHDLS